MDYGLDIVPYPKKVLLREGCCAVNDMESILINRSEEETLFPIAERLKTEIKTGTAQAIPIYINENGTCANAVSFKKCQGISNEGYCIKLSGKGMEIEYGSAAGAFYVVSTLKQVIMQFGNKIPCMVIEDEPDYKTRGVMVDISRNKIPRMKELFEFVEFISDLKINHLQLYVEGFSFAYPSFPEAWRDGTPITGKEIIELDKYCSDRYIELVPNQNSFGHMTAWLARDEFKDLAEYSGGSVDSMGLHEDPGTLNPLDPKAILLLNKIYGDILPYFSSKYFNVGLDEPFELGRGKSKAACDKYGTGRVYLDFLLKVYELVKAKNKRMMCWGDIIINYPELLQELPKDIIILEWGYESDHPFKNNCKRYKEAGQAFYVCPGTSSWKSILGRTRNMKENLENAALNGLESGAEGMITTDWGDCGHWQYPPISYAAFLYGAALSWNTKVSKDMDLEGYLNRTIYKDRRKITAGAVMGLGDYYLLEKSKAFNCTWLAHNLYTGISDGKILEGLDEEALNKIEVYIREIHNKLDLADMLCRDGVLIENEIKNSCCLILHSINLARLKIILNTKGKSSVPEKFLRKLLDDIGCIMENHRELWIARNRIGGLEESIGGMRCLKRQYEEMLSTILMN